MRILLFILLISKSASAQYTRTLTHYVIFDNGKQDFYYYDATDTTGISNMIDTIPYLAGREIRIGQREKLITTTTYTVVQTDFNRQTLHMSNTAARTVTLPDPATIFIDYPVTIKDKAGNCATNNITINAPVGATIDGASSFILNLNYGEISIKKLNDTQYTVK
jgi:hypothetical protein